MVTLDVSVIQYMDTVWWLRKAFFLLLKTWVYRGAYNQLACPHQFGGRARVNSCLRHECTMGMQATSLQSPELSSIIQLMHCPAQCSYCHSKHSLEEAGCSHTKRQGAKSAQVASNGLVQVSWLVAVG